MARPAVAFMIRVASPGLYIFRRVTSLALESLGSSSEASTIGFTQLGPNIATQWHAQTDHRLQPLSCPPFTCQDLRQ